MERALKRVRPFLDPKESIKARLSALKQFLESTGADEQAAFCGEHCRVLEEYVASSWSWFKTKLSNGINLWE